ncbi:MAG TPA: FtsX-like permease family protein [Bryobacteraceae bacterium]|nr:FtsX-like permease family protein [Bryobacteraceae bacterium]
MATLRDHLALPLTPASLAASVLGAFGFLAVVLAAIGVYGLMAYAVARRSREIGIRVAIGARKSRVLALVARRAGILLVVGTACGTTVALMASRLFSAVLCGINRHDPSTYLMAAALMAVIAIAACMLPVPGRSRLTRRVRYGMNEFA